MAPTLTAAKVIDTKQYIAVDPINNNNKFWKYERLDQAVSEPGKSGKMETGDIRFTWGRVGSEGESKLEMFNEKKLATKIHEKTHKKDGPSYVEVQTVGGTENMGTAAGKAVNNKEEIKRIAVKEIAGGCQITKHGVKMSLGNATFTSDNITFKLDIATIGQNGEVNNKYASDFKMCAPFYGFKPEHLGATFTTMGQIVKIVGWDRKSYKYPVLGEKSGKTYKYPVDTVQRALNLPTTNLFLK